MVGKVIKKITPKPVSKLAKKIAKKSVRAYNTAKRIRTPEFVRHCVIAIAQHPGKVAQIKAKGTVHGICQATYNKNKDTLQLKHPKGSHHTSDEYHDAADKLKEGWI